MSAQVIAASIAAAASLLSAVVAWALKQKSDVQVTAMREKVDTALAERKAESDRALAQLQDALAEARTERDAQRDYEYDARKRLYAEFQPVLFQLVEQCDSAFRRIANIAQSARLGYLSPENSWLTRDNDYYFPTTLYRLFAPVAMFRLFQRRLTIVDLSLDPDVRALYTLTKQMYLSWNSPWDLARSDPAIPYDPYAEQKPGEERVWAWQHVLIGQLDQIMDSMIIVKDDEARCINYGEFAARLDDKDSDLRRHAEWPSRIFDRFDPRSRPVLWRILLSQAHFHRAIMTSFELGPGQILHPAEALPRSEWSMFALNSGASSHPDRGEEPDDNGADDGESLVGTFLAVERYLRARVHLPVMPDVRPP